jgi:predicted alpha/beta-fold hydrolase
MKKEMIQILAGKRAVYVGETTGKPQLFCIHGGMGLDSNSLIPHLEGLSKIFDLVFIDLRGHGDSESALDGQYALCDFSVDVREIIKRLKGDQPCGIFGHSLGGMVAIQALADDQHLFNFAILSNTALDSSWQKCANESVATLEQKSLVVALQEYAEHPGDKTLGALAVLYGPLYFPELSKVAAAKHMADFTYKDTANSFLDEKVYPTMNLSAEVHKISTPTLIISGSQDPVVPVECQKALASALKNGTHEIITDAGHFPFVTKTEAFNKFVSNWWDNVRRKSL